MFDEIASWRTRKLWRWRHWKWLNWIFYSKLSSIFYLLIHVSRLPSGSNSRGIMTPNCSSTVLIAERILKNRKEQTITAAIIVQCLNANNFQWRLWFIPTFSPSLHWLCLLEWPAARFVWYDRRDEPLWPRRYSELA